MQREKMQKRVEEAVLDSYEAMYRIALTYVRDQEDALDIVQESVYKAIRNAGQVKNEQYIPTWICRIVINTAIDFLKKNQKEILVEEFYDYQDVGKEDQYEDTDTLKALDALNEKERAVIILRFFEDKKLEEIAIILNANISTVKSLLYRSLAKLKVEMLEGDLQYEG